MRYITTLRVPRGHIPISYKVPRYKINIGTSPQDPTTFIEGSTTHKWVSYGEYSGIQATITSYKRQLRLVNSSTSRRRLQQQKAISTRSTLTPHMNLKNNSNKNKTTSKQYHLIHKQNTRYSKPLTWYHNKHLPQQQG